MSEQTHAERLAAFLTWYLLTPRETRTGDALLASADPETGVVQPTWGELQWRMACSRSTAYRGIRDLKRRGVIEAIGLRDGGPVRYRFLRDEKPPIRFG